ncbi:bacillithiol system redox-active protein YtxJ [Flagellimonas sediminis]|uniref:Bacillithiol system redox-active protein YtxJ n=1 Tax=Flagellimonas sediminis TaxID=2696468 RepID=A0A6I5KT21_9FLAO|nr:bacillithiol system redox-active protein YtxJ [Allomuricauda sediminis]NDV44074.1 bacillithiol system redox-active protein YtxJ [Allomuricauda sediminis]
MGIFDSVFGKKEKQGNEKKQLPWIELKELAQLERILEKSKDRAQVIYKHSRTCGISSMVLSMFTQSYDLDADCDLYFLTIQHHRDISNEIAQKFGVRHESPQLLVVKNGEVTFHTSHGAIADTDLKQKL